MSKAILVMDMPYRCQSCQLCETANDICFGTEEPTEIDNPYKKPEWCPLKELPDDVSGDI